jgi:glucose/arabinose dehydrogenase
VIRLTAVLAAALLVSSCTAGASSSDSTGSAEPTPLANGLSPIGAGLAGPAGLTATVFASGILQAAALAFDTQGRLWVATAAYTDTGQDGVNLVTAAGATPIEVISGLHTALGLLWVGDSLYVASAGGVEAYSGFSGTAFASHRTILALPAGVGEVNELVLGSDGRLRLGVTSPCDHCVPTSADSAAVLSFAPDGSDLQVEAAAIRAPVGLVYAPGTSDLFVTMNQRDDLGDLTPGDWLAVVSTGQAWGFPACYGQGGSACTGVPSPVAVLDKHAAVSGVAIVGAPFSGTAGAAAIVAEWALGKVQRVRLSGSGTATSGTVEPFITGIANPVPVLLAPDGSLFIGDWKTGTIYRLAGS